MLSRVAFIAAAVGVASMAGAVTPADPPAAAPLSCQPGQSLDFDCTLRALDADGDGSVSATELANFALPAPPSFDWSPLPPSGGIGADFKDAATESRASAPPATGRSGPPTMLSALLALCALVVLLRRRPA